MLFSLLEIQSESGPLRILSMKNNLRNRIYYQLKPLFPRHFQLFLRRRYVAIQALRYRDIWPIDPAAGEVPAGWTGWPDEKKFALVLTHDVDTERGQERCMDLADMENRLGFRSSFNFVPLRYRVSPDIRFRLEEQGFEIGVHGLYHDGKYYQSRKIFQERADVINQYLKDWKCVGYRAPCMDARMEWFHDLQIEYDSSTFDTDPFEPNSNSVRTIFPFLVRNGETNNCYVEIPYTLPQDFTLFVLMQLRTIDIWKIKLEWIVKKGGVVVLNTHPDYMNFISGGKGPEDYPASYYEDILMHIKKNYAGQYLHILPRDLARFWMRLPRT